MFGTKRYNTYNEAIVVVIMVIYLLFTNLLLVNLLIAVFKLVQSYSLFDSFFFF